MGWADASKMVIMVAGPNGAGKTTAAMAMFRRVMPETRLQQDYAQ